MMLGSVTKVERTGWVVVAQTPLFMTFAPYAAALGLAFLASVAIWLALGWNLRNQLVERIVDPIATLRQKSTALAQGEFNLPLSGLAIPCAFSEIHQLAEDFDTMSRAVRVRETALQNSQKQLLASESKYRIVADNTNDWEFWYGPDGRCLYSSPSCERISGYTPADFEALPELMSRLIHPEDLALFDKHWREALSGQQSGGQELELRLLSRDGTPRWIGHVCEPMYETGDQFLGIRGSNRDITVRKRIEMQLREAKEMAEAANKVKSSFLANMSHEIRTPLNGVIATFELITMDELSAEQAEYAAVGMTAAKRLLRLLNDILDISRIDADKLEISSEQFNPRELLHEAIGLFSLEAGRKGVSLKSEIAPSVMERLIGDPARILQVLFNLIGNAVKFTSKGAVTVSLSDLPLQDDLAHRRLLFIISDTGPGITLAQIPRLFHPFAQADSSYTKKFQGAGLGLSIVRRLVALMGGTICVDSIDGVGTDLYVTVKTRLPSENQSPAPICVIDSNPTPALHVLVAEDDSTSRDLILVVLKKLGHQTQAAQNGLETLEMLNGYRFDLILMDVQMPVMDGVEATKAIRGSTTLGAKSSIPIIAMTAYAMTGDKEIFLAAGMNDYISKPVDREGLIEVIERVMASSRKTQ